MSSFVNTKFANNLYNTQIEIADKFEVMLATCEHKMEKMHFTNEKNPNEQVAIYSIESKDLDYSKKPNIIFMLFGEHPREIISPEESLFLAEALCGKITGYDKSTINKILSFSKIYILPVLNAYGRDQVENGDYCQRTDQNGVDLNRNWGSHWESETTIDAETSPGKKAFSEWEVRELKNFLTDLKPNSFLTVHSGNLGIYSPFAYKKFNKEDLDGKTSKKLDKIGAIIQKVNQDYCNCVAGSVGNDLGYLCPGTCLDYLFENLNVDYSFAFEIYSQNRKPFYNEILYNPDLDYFSYEKFSKKYKKNTLKTLTSYIQMKAKMGMKPSDLSGDKSMTCFAQRGNHISQASEKCLDYFNPSTELAVKNTMINWTNLFFEIYSLIDLDKK